MLTLDLSSIRSTSNLKVKNQQRAVIPEIILYETATSSEHERQIDLTRKLSSLCISNPGLIYSGKDPAQLMQEQKGTHHRQRLGAVVNTSSSRFTLTPEVFAVDDWSKKIAVIHQSTAVSFYEDRKIFLHEVANAFCRYLEIYAPDRLKQVRSNKARAYELALEDTLHPETIRQFTQILLRDGTEKRYLSKDWQHALSNNPNNYALGRLTRLFIWYCYIGMANHSKDFRNAMEDMQYVFLASYTNTLATEDKGMRAAASNLWPYIKLLSFTQCFENHKG